MHLCCRRICLPGHPLVLVPSSAIPHTHCFVLRLSSGGTQLLPSEEMPRCSSVDGLSYGWHSKDGTVQALAPPALRQPLHTPQHAAYLWHNARRTPVLQAAKQPSHYLRHFELKPPKSNDGLRTMGASDPGQVLGSKITASSLQRCVSLRGVDA